MSVTIVTPTYKRAESTLLNCIKSIDAQTYTNYHHMIIIDDDTFEGHVTEEFRKKHTNNHREFVLLGRRSNNFGNTPRQSGIDLAVTDFMVFIDDDNVVFPDYLEKMVNGIGSADFALAKIIHMGPLPQHYYPPPRVIDGSIIKKTFVDTLQLIVRTNVIKQTGWFQTGYCADGDTIENLGNHYTHALIDHIVGVHLH